MAKSIVRRAREIMGDPVLRSTGPAMATAALHQAAVELKQTLTPNHVAIERAGQASLQLDLYVASMQESES